jgi:hypothetical protein
MADTEVAIDNFSEVADSLLATAEVVLEAGDPAAAEELIVLMEELLAFAPEFEESLGDALAQLRELVDADPDADPAFAAEE